MFAGEWARFFRAGAGSLGTELWRDGAEYRRRSAKTETLYRSETALGRFEPA
jgi:hypothetical protein